CLSSKERQAVVCVSIARVAFQYAAKIGLSARGIDLESRDAARDAQHGFVWIFDQKCGEPFFGFVDLAHTRKCLPKRGPQRPIIAWEGDCALEVVVCGSDLIQLELNHGAVDECLGEAGVKLDGSIVCVLGIEKVPGPGEGKCAVEMSPGEPRTAYGTGGEVG